MTAERDLSSRPTGQRHIGTPRFYECPERKKKPQSPTGLSCAQALFVEDGSLIPICQDHLVPYQKRKWKTPVEVVEDLRARTTMFFAFGVELLVFKDAAARRSECFMCRATINKGEPRVGFDWGVASKTTIHGGWFNRRRRYVHRSCLIDAIFDGKPGEGCPGCTMKMADREFRDYKKYVKEQLRGQT